MPLTNISTISLWQRGLLSCVCLAMLGACTPTVKVAPSDKPITINLNVKIEHEIRVKVDKDLEDRVFNDDSGLF